MNIKSLSGADLARCFGVDRSMVTRWKKAGMPEIKGLFCLPACIKWRLEREADAMAPKSGTSTEGEKWLTAFRRERARTAKLERLEKQGKLISLEKVESENIERAGDLRQSLMAFSSRLSPVLEMKPRETVRETLKTECSRLLENYCKQENFSNPQKKKIAKKPCTASPKKK